MFGRFDQKCGVGRGSFDIFDIQCHIVEVYLGSSRSCVSSLESVDYDFFFSINIRI